MSGKWPHPLFGLTVLEFSIVLYFLVRDLLSHAQVLVVWILDSDWINNIHFREINRTIQWIEICSEDSVIHLFFFAFRSHWGHLSRDCFGDSLEPLRQPPPPTPRPPTCVPPSDKKDDLFLFIDLMYMILDTIRMSWPFMIVVWIQHCQSDDKLWYR